MVDHYRTVADEPGGKYRPTCSCGWKGRPSQSRDQAKGQHSGHIAKLAPDVSASPAGQSFFTAKDIALATMTPEQEAAAQQGCCMKCAQPSLSEKTRERGMRWLQCSRCQTVYALGVALPRVADDDLTAIEKFLAKRRDGAPFFPADANWLANVAALLVAEVRASRGVTEVHRGND